MLWMFDSLTYMIPVVYTFYASQRPLTPAIMFMTIMGFKIVNNGYVGNMMRCLRHCADSKPVFSRIKVRAGHVDRYFVVNTRSTTR